jgi:hypothetical protein
MLTLKSYEDVVASVPVRELISHLPDSLMPLWCDDYYNVNPRAELVTVDLNDSGSTFTYLFDLALQRIVVACGVPIVPEHGRDYSRQAGYPKPQKRFVKGHLIAHSMGGGMDINFIPQLGSMNGGAFRKIEKLAQKSALENVKSFYFVRALYHDATEVPRMLEQCLVYPSGRMSYELHRNW